MSLSQSALFHSVKVISSSTSAELCFACITESVEAGEWVMLFM